MLIVGDLHIRLAQPSQPTFNDEELYDFCQLNPELRIERDADQNILIMSPVGGRSGALEFQLAVAIGNWIAQHGGYGFSSATGFLLPNGAVRSPDGCWVSDARWAVLTDAQKERFLPVVPDFVIEVRSRTDALATLQAKMQEWIDNGVRLAWLIDPTDQQVFLYRPQQPAECRTGFDQRLSGEDVMPGFVLDLAQLRLP